MHHDKQPQTHFRFYWLHDEANVNAYHEITQWLEQEHCEQGSRILPICIQACAASSIIDFDFNSERACLASHVRAWREYTRSPLPTSRLYSTTVLRTTHRRGGAIVYEIVIT
jgi:hypothetical protein